MKTLFVLICALSSLTAFASKDLPSKPDKEILERFYRATEGYREKPYELSALTWYVASPSCAKSAEEAKTAVYSY